MNENNKYMNTVVSNTDTNIKILGVRVRRSLKKMKGGEISVPVQKTNHELRKAIKRKVASGEYDLGITVLETQHKKLKMNADGKIEERTSSISARKYPFQTIREKTLKMNKNIIRQRTDNEYQAMSREEIKERLIELNEKVAVDEDMETLKQRLLKYERTRNWLLWHDHSTISNCGFMLFMVREMYDPAIHLSNDEYKDEPGITLDVQSRVEAPHLYLLGASSSKDIDQLKFVPTRRECLKGLSNPIVSEQGIKVYDNMRMMNGDSPAAEFEDGTQKGGHKGCAGCDGDMMSAYDYEYMAYRKYKSLDEKRTLVVSGKYGSTNTTHPFKELKVQQLRNELKARKCNTEGNQKDLQSRLKDILGGTTRVPALLYGENEKTSLSELNLQNYEVLFFEPLHTCLNHIATLLNEIPLHLTDVNTLLEYKEVISLTLNKDKLRATDYRKALLKISIKLADTLPENERKLLLTFCEMQGVYYNNDDKRSPRQVLRLHNISFQHSIYMHKCLVPPKSVTLRKLFGIYYHGAVDHAPFLYRLVCLRSINAELFERYFDRIDNITKKTWGKHVETLIPNALLHIQAEDQISPQGSTFLTQEREISKLANHLPIPSNSTFSKEYLMKNGRLWQAHLSKIPDYIITGKGTWWDWNDDGSVTFYDSPGEPDTRPTGPMLYHMRSHSIVGVQRELDKVWEDCCSAPEKMPIYKLRDKKGQLIFNRDDHYKGK